jgi:hypothetical protein
MTHNGSGPTTAATVERARRSDQLDSKISFENNTASPKYKFHPLASVFPLMEGEEFDALVADIKANGVQNKIVLYQGKILDGRNRFRAMLALEYNDEFIKAECQPLHEILGYAQARDLPKDEARKWVISANIHRRHLTAEQKRDLIAKLIKAQPEKSNRQIAKTTGTSHPHVAKVRAELEKSGDVETVTTSIDTKGRKQPSRKAVVLGEAKQLIKATLGGSEREETAASELASSLRAAEIKIVGLESQVEELKAENADLRQQLEAFKSPVRCEFVENDGGRAAAGYREPVGDCVARAITIATGKPYTEVFEALKAAHARYVKRLRPGSDAAVSEERGRKEPVYNGCSEKVYGHYLRLPPIHRLAIHANKRTGLSPRQGAPGRTPDRGREWASRRPNRWRDPRHLRQRRGRETPGGRLLDEERRAAG